MLIQEPTFTLAPANFHDMLCMTHHNSIDRPALCWAYLKHHFQEASQAFVDTSDRLVNDVIRK